MTTDLYFSISQIHNTIENDFPTLQFAISHDSWTRPGILSWRKCNLVSFKCCTHRVTQICFLSALIVVKIKEAQILFYVYNSLSLSIERFDRWSSFLFCFCFYSLTVPMLDNAIIAEIIELHGLFLHLMCVCVTQSSNTCKLSLTVCWWLIALECIFEQCTYRTKHLINLFVKQRREKKKKKNVLDLFLV